jgi:hypothetical protein
MFLPTSDLIVTNRSLRTLCLLLVFIQCLVVAGQEHNSGGPNPRAAKEIFDLVNQERSQAGLSQLQWDDRLAQAALDHALLMAEHKALSHQFSGEPSLRLRLARTSLRLDRSGENVAYDPTIGGAHLGLMNSPPHRANILSPDYNSVGIAAVRRGEYFYVVEDFAHRLPESSAAQVEDEITAAFARARSQAGFTPIPRVTRERLRQDACAMASTDTVDAKAVDVPLARYLLAFTVSQPQKLPDDLLRLRTNEEIGSFAIGTCFQRTATYPSGVYWNLMAFFPKTGAKSK